ncbi:MAG: hypothetical protein KC502_08620 [Myxococcales bacterium]|nr:hypothetical protein [Myxococcales bacterium]
MSALASVRAGGRAALVVALVVALTGVMGLLMSCSRTLPPQAIHTLPRDPAAPIQLAVSHRGALPVGQPTQLLLKLTPDAGHSWLSTAVRGVRGVQVTGGQRQQWQRTPQQPDAARSVVVTAAAGVHGYVAVDVGWRDPRAGTEMNATFAVPVHAMGAIAATPALGTVEQGPDGQSVQVLR